MSEARKKLALEATYEIESIARVLNKNLAMTEADAFARSMVLRVHQLNALVMGVLGDDTTELEELQETLQGIVT